MKRIRSVPPAEFAREAAALRPSKSFWKLRTESRVQSVSTKIAVRHKRKRLILPAPRVLAVAMRLSPRHGVGFAAGPGCCTTGFVSSKGFLLALARGEESDFAQGRLFAPESQNEKKFKIGKSLLSR